MKKNIFDNAKFGDKFKTKNGELAIYKKYDIKSCLHILFTENYPFRVDDNGILAYWDKEYSGGLDIVSHWTENIDDDKLNELAINDLYPDDKYSYGTPTAEAKRNIWIWKRGYQTAINDYKSTFTNNNINTKNNGKENIFSKLIRWGMGR